MAFSVYEHGGPDDPISAGDIDGMSALIEGDADTLSSDWDLAFENPPHEFLAGLDLQGLGKT